MGGYRTTCKLDFWSKWAQSEFTSTCESGFPSVLSSGVEVPLCNQYVLNFLEISQTLTVNSTGNYRASSLQSLHINFVACPINATISTILLVSSLNVKILWKIGPSNEIDVYEPDRRRSLNHRCFRCTEPPGCGCRLRCTGPTTGSAQRSQPKHDNNNLSYNTHRYAWRHAQTNQPNMTTTTSW